MSKLNIKISKADLVRAICANSVYNCRFIDNGQIIIFEGDDLQNRYMTLPDALVEAFMNGNAIDALEVV